jgi:RHS repeat-associated protein
VNLNWAPERVNGGTEDPNFASLDSVVSISLRFSRSTTAEHTTCQYDSGTDTLLYPSISTTWSTTAWPHTCSGGRPAITGVQRIGQCVNVTDAWTPRSVSYDRTVRVCQTTDDARTISRSHTYDASRNNQHSFAATSTAYRFTGKERDSESGNDYFGARYYASTMGRFMSPDFNDYGLDPAPVPWADYSNPQSLNLYAYVQNNPLSRTDDFGHDVQVCDNNGHCNTVSNDAYKAAQQAQNSGGLNAPTLDQVGNSKDANGNFTSVGITSTDANGNTTTVGSATYVASDNPGIDPYMGNNMAGLRTIGVASATVGSVRGIASFYGASLAGAACVVRVCGSSHSYPRSSEWCTATCGGVLGVYGNSCDCSSGNGSQGAECRWSWEARLAKCTEIWI